MALPDLMKKVRDKENLSTIETRVLFDAIFEGALPEGDLSAVLLGLHAKGETTDELLGAVLSMRSKAVTIPSPLGAIDIVGTGGDARNTLNVSTATAFVVAACGVPVAKHGNRASTSRSGSSDVLAALGINLEPPFEILEECLSIANLCFLFAPRHHPAMRHVVDIRKKLGVRTIFNLLGPLTNPACVRRHLIGVYAREWLWPVAEVLRKLASETAWVSHGSDGLDELTTAGESDVAILRNNIVSLTTINPLDIGIPIARALDIAGGDAAYNAVALKNLLAGATGAYHDLVTLNAAAALVVADKVKTLAEGVAFATESLASGAPRAILEKVITLTNRAI